MDRSATPVIFGFLFQANAAILLMLDNIKELKSIRLEHNEDIDIELSDGTYILAQAKSVVKSSTDFTHVKANAKKAIVSLSDGSARVSAKELIYITNSPDPFKDSSSKSMFYGLAIVKYTDLPPATKKIIKEYLSEISSPFDESKLIIRVLPFEGDNDRQRNRVVLEEIADFLYRINMDSTGSRRHLHAIWESMLIRSGSKKDKDITLKKKDIVWPIIVCVTRNDSLNRENMYCNELDDGEFEEINNKYEELINFCSERYELVAKIIADYSLVKNRDKDSVNLFINDHWNDYIDDFGLDQMDDRIKCSLVKMIMYKILCKRYVIDRIKKEVNL